MRHRVSDKHIGPSGRKTSFATSQPHGKNNIAHTRGESHRCAEPPNCSLDRSSGDNSIQPSSSRPIAGLRPMGGSARGSSTTDSQASEPAKKDELLGWASSMPGSIAAAPLGNPWPAQHHGPVLGQHGDRTALGSCGTVPTINETRG